MRVLSASLETKTYSPTTRTMARVATDRNDVDDLVRLGVDLQERVRNGRTGAGSSPGAITAATTTAIVTATATNAPMVARRRRLAAHGPRQFRRRAERGILVQDRLLELAKRGSGLEPELLLQQRVAPSR